MVIGAGSIGVAIINEREEWILLDWDDNWYKILKGGLWIYPTKKEDTNKGLVIGCVKER